MEETEPAKQPNMVFMCGEFIHGLGVDTLAYLKQKPIPVKFIWFADNECNCEILDSVRGKDVVILNSIGRPNVNGSLMQTLAMADAAARAGAMNIRLVCPYQGYGRSDYRKKGIRSAVMAKVAADLFVAVGIKQVVVVEEHSKQIELCYTAKDCVFDGLRPRDFIIARLVREDPVIKEALAAGRFTIGSPDAGGVERAKAYRSKFGPGVKLVIVDKTRDGPNQSHAGDVIGDAEGKDILLVDDMIDTAGTMVNSAAELKKRGARSVRALGIHPVLSKPALERIESSVLECVYTCDTLPPQVGSDGCSKLKTIKLGPFLGDVIQRLMRGMSLKEISS